ncbi:geranylgeranyl transferase type-2 subunit alpha isoform X2 [Ooceraea biroi]|uniref:Geranylgeranyl transferase type-2 subunit alpha n=1 Tax=Ooceraea biroi TaxID=2015173 RepID=A0A026W2I9_OOCBI|nr:geranylgeranyl transferase type-2 subunit alpha isoform X2 [Ooceraea biroi]XP_026829031.1 geranylgeranyl transferase type-2 subunit alpha isoform X2 [Ooceraea biroi]EZA50218.1 Geranylgeranyl transferase type-2 subunit alpha [Ooceraea biroi]
MHGRVKVRTTAEQEAIRKKERAAKVAQYKADIAIVFQKRKDKLLDDELLTITRRMLLTNPDIYTLWNIRREAFESNERSDGTTGDKETKECSEQELTQEYECRSEEDYKQLLENELSLTESCLKENPKSYSAWHQRCWVMERMPEPDWNRELSLCAKCLNLDERNFHCWDYRKFVVGKAGISDREEFEFSSTKILNNFSNYSSWHYRSRILSRMFGSTGLEEIPILDEVYREELDLVMNATFTDPNDTSAWFYQRWLLDKCVTTCRLWRAYVKKDMVHIIIDNNMLVKPVSLSLCINGEAVKAEWQSYPEQKFAKLPTAGYFASRIEENLHQAKEVSVKLQETTYPLSYSKSEGAWIYKDNSSLHKRNSNDEQLSEQLRSYNQLSEMEPNNKWALLTGVLLMKKIDFHKFYTDILNNLAALSKVDSFRKNYYADLRSKLVIEYKLHEIWKAEGDLEMQSRIDLSRLDLTKLHNNHYFGFFEEVNLCANKLQNCLPQLSTLHRCTKLSLSSNGLTSLKRFPTLRNLEVLSLRNNKLVSADEIVDLIKRHRNLKKLDLRDNPVCDKIDPDKIKYVKYNLALYLK